MSTCATCRHWPAPAAPTESQGCCTLLRVSESDAAKVRDESDGRYLVTTDGARTAGTFSCTHFEERRAFAREYLGTFADPTPEERHALAVWCDYFNDCNGYDRTVCTGRFNHSGNPIPATDSERAAIEANAARARRRALAALGGQEFRAQREQAARLSQAERAEVIRQERSPTR